MKIWNRHVRMLYKTTEKFTAEDIWNCLNSSEDVFIYLIYTEKIAAGCKQCFVEDLPHDFFDIEDNSCEEI